MRVDHCMQSNVQQLLHKTGMLLFKAHFSLLYWVWYQVMMVNQVPWLTAWEMQGEKTVVLGIDTQEEMEELALRAQDRTLLVYSVRHLWNVMSILIF